MGQTLSERMQVNIWRWGVGGFTHSTGGGIRGKCSKFKRENYQKTVEEEKAGEQGSKIRGGGTFFMVDMSPNLEGHFMRIQSMHPTWPHQNQLILLVNNV